MRKKTASNWRHLRYLLLLLILLAVVWQSYFVKQKLQNWETPLSVVVLPITGDDSEIARQYVQSLNSDNFDDISEFIDREAKHFRSAADRSLNIRLAPAIQATPPALPSEQTALGNISWSLRFRAWANWQLFKHDARDADIALFVLYFDPKTSPRLRHSVGLPGSQLGLINAFADKSYRGSNSVVITHELLHTLGATDKYAPGTNQPLFPTGFAEPNRKPLYPQRYAEIMGGRIPLSPNRSETPASLRKVVIGEQTAREIHWR